MEKQANTNQNQNVTPTTPKLHEVYQKIGNTVYEFNKKKSGITKGGASYKYFTYNDTIDPVLQDLRAKEIVITYQTFFDYVPKITEKKEGEIIIKEETQIPKFVTTKVVLESPVDIEGKTITGHVLLNHKLPFEIEQYVTEAKKSTFGNTGTVTNVSYEVGCNYEKALQSKLTFHERSTLLRFFGFHDESETGFEEKEDKQNNYKNQRNTHTPPNPINENKKTETPPLDDKKTINNDTPPTPPSGTQEIANNDKGQRAEDLMKKMLEKLK